MYRIGSSDLKASIYSLYNYIKKIYIFKIYRGLHLGIATTILKEMNVKDHFGVNMSIGQNMQIGCFTRRPSIWKVNRPAHWKFGSLAGFIYTIILNRPWNSVHMYAGCFGLHLVIDTKCVYTDILFLPNPLLCYLGCWWYPTQPYINTLIISTGCLLCNAVYFYYSLYVTSVLHILGT